MSRRSSRLFTSSSLRSRLHKYICVRIFTSRLSWPPHSSLFTSSSLCSRLHRYIYVCVFMLRLSSCLRSRLFAFTSLCIFADTSTFAPSRHGSLSIFGIGCGLGCTNGTVDYVYVKTWKLTPYTSNCCHVSLHVRVYVHVYGAVLGLSWPSETTITQCIFKKVRTHWICDWFCIQFWLIWYVRFGGLRFVG